MRRIEKGQTPKSSMLEWPCDEAAPKKRKVKNDDAEFVSHTGSLLTSPSCHLGSRLSPVQGRGEKRPVDDIYCDLPPEDAERPVEISSSPGLQEGTLATVDDDFAPWPPLPSERPVDVEARVLATPAERPVDVSRKEAATPEGRPVDVDDLDLPPLAGDADVSRPTPLVDLRAAKRPRRYRVSGKKRPSHLYTCSAPTPPTKRLRIRGKTPTVE